MAITRLIYGGSAMQGLFLMQDQWYERHRINTWLNTQVIAIDPEQRQVRLGTGQTLAYDRLILTAGSTNFVPPIEGFGAGGSFVLREAEDAMRIRAYVQERRCQRAAIAGGGLLGLEAAYALKKLGLHVTVLEVADRLLHRQLDERASELLRRYLEGLGIEIALAVQAELEVADGRVAAVKLSDGSRIQAELFLVSAGIRPNVEIARDAGLEINRGVVVDDHMRTSDPNIFAAGDVAEREEMIHGLWRTAVDQAQVAAANAVGGNETYTGTVPVTMLKVTGVDVTSAGRFEPAGPEDEVIVHGGRRGEPLPQARRHGRTRRRRDSARLCRRGAGRREGREGVPGRDPWVGAPTRRRLVVVRRRGSGARYNGCLNRVQRVRDVAIAVQCGQ